MGVAIKEILILLPEPEKAGVTIDGLGLSIRSDGLILVEGTVRRVVESVPPLLMKVRDGKGNEGSCPIRLDLLPFQSFGVDIAAEIDGKTMRASVAVELERAHKEKDLIQ